MIPILYSVLHLTNNKKNENLNFKKIKKRKFLNDTNSIFKCVILQGKAFSVTKLPAGLLCY